MYIYPENLTAKPTLFLWQLRDVAILAAALVLMSPSCRCEACRGWKSWN